MAQRLLGSAVGAAWTVVEVARHVLWYVSYQVDGNGSARLDEAARKLTTPSA